MSNRAWIVAVAVSVMGVAFAARAREPRERDIDFVRDVQPILREHCLACHGPKKDKADLRLDVRSRALAGAWGGTEPVIVPGRASESSLYTRLVTDEVDERMPHKAAPLERVQIETIRAWIDAGAPWPDEAAGSDARGVSHWAYTAPVKATLPSVDSPEHTRHPIDAFVQARWKLAGLTPTPEADRATLLRRLSLDLIGLPPTVAELESFERDLAPDAYERAVDRLLASPHLGERLARPWLDLARFADTHGYEKDARRSMDTYRDWVIEAFNSNMPFDVFSIRQLAGDLLPNASDSDRIATAFHRNTMLNEEGGTDAEEFRVDAVIDRVNTTATVWLGSTLACAQCHDHKYDPFSQRDYYRLFAAFNATADGGRESGPTLSVPSGEQQNTLDLLNRSIADLHARLAALEPSLDREQARWEREVSAHLPPPTRWLTLFASSARGDAGSNLSLVSDGSVLASGATPSVETYEIEFEPRTTRFSALRLETLPDHSFGGVASRAEHGNFVLSTLAAEWLPRDPGSAPIAITFATAEGDHEQTNGPFRAASSLDGSLETGWAIGGADVRVPHEAVFVSEQPIDVPQGARLRVRMTFGSRFERHLLGRFRFSIADDPALLRRMTTPKLGPWRSVGPFRAATFEDARDTAFEPEREHIEGRAHALAYADGSLSWVERSEWADRTMQRLDGDRCATYLERTIWSEAPRRIELFVGGDDSIRVWLNGELVHKNDDFQTLLRNQDRVEVRLREGANTLLYKIVNGAGGYGFYFDIGRRTDDRRSIEVERALRTAPNQRSERETTALREWFRRFQSPTSAGLWSELREHERRRDGLRATFPSVLVMRELPEPRETRIFQRGSFLSPGERVEPGVPEIFGTFDDQGEPARLALARWLVGPQNPLAARAQVNRMWEMLFGRGLVATVEDFGTRGDPPTHPELLDWLAVDFVESGWNVKHLLKSIVMSSTYRQSSDAGAADYERDPDNSWLARGSRYRVEAEMLRDVALESAGLLVKKIGGPSVFPPQPAGTWNSAYSGDDWLESVGENRYRRGLYTFVKRTAPYVTHALFEAPSREVACTRRPRTNTPLQALALLDDPVFVEASVALAGRMLHEVGADDAARIEFGFRVCTARPCTERERDVLRLLLERSREAFELDPEAASARVASLRRSDARATDDVELAAWTSLASVLLNLDDTVSRR